MKIQASTKSGNTQTSSDDDTVQIQIGINKKYCVIAFVLTVAFYFFIYW